CTFAGNVASGGSSLANTGGSAEGGGIEWHGGSGSFTLNSSTVVGNSAGGGNGTTRGNSFGGGLVKVSGISGNVVLKSSLVSRNSAASAPDVSGSFVSQGYNLIGAVDGSSGFNQPTDHTG